MAQVYEDLRSSQAALGNLAYCIIKHARKTRPTARQGLRLLAFILNLFTPLHTPVFLMVHYILLTRKTCPFVSVSTPLPLELRCLQRGKKCRHPLVSSPSVFRGGHDLHFFQCVIVSVNAIVVDLLESYHDRVPDPTLVAGYDLAGGFVPVGLRPQYPHNGAALGANPWLLFLLSWRLLSRGI